MTGQCVPLALIFGSLTMKGKARSFRVCGVTFFVERAGQEFLVHVNMLCKETVKSLL